MYLIVEDNINAPKGPLNYKVGKSKDPVDRLRDLQTGNPRKLQFIYEIPVDNMTAKEGAAKQALKGYKCALGGGTEWFTADSTQKADLMKKFTEAVK